MPEENFEEKGVSVHVQKKPNCLIELLVSLDKSHCQTCNRKAVKQICKEISIPGFRKGHAPETLIRERFSPQLDKQYKEELIQEAFREGIRLCDIYPRSQEAIQKAKLEKLEEDSATVLFVFESAPVLPKIDLSQISIEKVPLTKVEEKEIDEVVESIRGSHQIYEDCTDTIAKKGATVKISVTGQTESGELLHLFKERLFVLDEKIPQWLSSAIIGMEVGQVKDGVVPIDTDALPPTLTITLDKILESKLPEVDDELAKKVGAKTLADMREKILHNLKRKAEESQKESQLEDLRKKLVAFYEIELPLTLVEEEKKARLTRKEQQLRSANTPEENLTKLFEEFEESLEEKVITDLRLYFILTEIAKMDRISLSKAERQAIYAYETELHQRYFGAGKHPERLKQALENAEFSAMLRKIEEHALAKVLAKT